MLFRRTCGDGSVSNRHLRPRDVGCQPTIVRGATVRVPQRLPRPLHRHEVRDVPRRCEAGDLVPAGQGAAICCRGLRQCLGLVGVQVQKTRTVGSLRVVTGPLFVIPPASGGRCARSTPCNLVSLCCDDVTK